MHLAASLVLVASVVAGLLWLAERHDALARENTAKMVTSKIASFERRYRDINRDDSVWTEALQAIEHGDVAWLYNNIGTAASVGTVDLVVLVPPRGATPIGWTAKTPEAGAPNLLPPDVIAAMLHLLDGTAPDSKAVKLAYARLDGTLWALTVSRVIDTDGTMGGRADADLPRQIHGVRLDHLVGDIASQFNLPDVHLAATRLPGDDARPLDLVGGGSAAIVWIAPRPGSRILAQTALPLAVIVLAFVTAGLLLGRYATRAARRLEVALVGARAADRAKTEFLGNISHELRTPMNGIIGLSQVLRTTPLGNDQRDLLDTMTACADAQMRLIEALLDITQIESGKRILLEEPFDPSDLVAEVARVGSLAAERKGLALRVEDCAEPSLRVLGDRGAIRQILANLVDNAVKFTVTGGIVLRIETTERDGGLDLRMAVADTGIGIAPEERERIFQRLTQIDGSTTRAAEGLGLGLSICRSLAELIGGRIHLDSAPGDGATFTLEVRLARAPAAEPTLSAAA